MNEKIRTRIAMLKIRHGSVYAFFLKEKNQYGLIQALDKGKICGRNVRIFYDLVNDLEYKTIEKVIQSDRFYYICDFQPAALVGTSSFQGRYQVPDFVTTPQYMRKSERQPDGRLYWYVLEDLRVVRTYEQFDESLKTLSPADAWGITYIKKRWLEGFSLESWHEWEDKWYMDYLRIYEPEKLPEFEHSTPDGDEIA